MKQRQPLWTTGLLILLCALFAFPAAAQDTAGNLPSQLDLVLASLSQGVRADVSVDDLEALNFNRRQFSDASLDCPQPGQMYAQVITPGYQFLLTYNGTVYDYRVSDDGQTVVLCDSRPSEPVSPTAAPPAQDCGDSYTVAQGDRLLDIARQCDTSVAALMAANPAIPYPSLIYTGMVLTIPDGSGGSRSVSIGAQNASPGTFVTVYASGFPPGALVQVGFGPPESEYEVVATRETASDGELYAAAQIPSYYRVGGQLVGVVVLNGQETVSDPFTLQAASVPPVPTTAPTAPPEGAFFDRTQIYLVALGDQGQSGQQIGCGDSLIPVTVTFEPTVAPLTAALGELFAIDTRTYGQSGLYNPLYQSDLQVDGIDIVDGVATINLSGDLSVGGTCDVPRVQSVLGQTALQYVTISQVNINVNGQPLGDALS